MLENQRNFSEVMNERARDFLMRRGILVPAGVELPIRGADQEIFAVKTPSFSEILSPGVRFEARAIDLPDGAFTNSYECIVAAEASSHVEVRSEPLPQFMHKVLRDSRVNAIINGGFFLLTDEHEIRPQEAPLNFCVRNGSVTSLPVTDRPAIVQTSSGIEGRMIKADGMMRIGTRVFSWEGALRPAQTADATLFSPGCCHVERGMQKGARVQPRTLDVMKNRTPRDAERADLVVRLSDDGGLRVVAINDGGDSNLFDGNFIVRLSRADASAVSVGDAVFPETIDALRFQDIVSAITVGPSIVEGAEPGLDKLSVNNDPSLGNRPFLDERTARSVIYRTQDGAIHLRVFDGVRDSGMFKGVTPRETHDLIRTEHSDSVEWGFHLDGGQSARAIIRRHDSAAFEPYGNLHYVRWPWKGSEDQARFFLDPWRGRKIASVLCIVGNE